MTERSLAIVTGGSRGIGRAIALDLAKLGFDLVISHFDFTAGGRPDSAPARQAAQQLEAAGAVCEALRADIADAEDRKNLVELARERFGRCDMLVNNAGMAPDERVDILDAKEASFDRVLAVNLKGPYFLTQAVAKWMIDQKERFTDRVFRIVNISSISSYTSSPSRGQYCVSKAGVSMMTKLYADRLAEYGIGVFEIRPGIIETDMTRPVNDKYDALIAQGLTPVKRWGRPQDVARAVGAIAEGRLDFSTGQVIDVDGGFSLRRL
jgi:NAD(P)-dependent dehydrogenase (short-subunit alcohol dehydrogenase family)